MIEIKVATEDLVSDVGTLFGTDRAANGCWCMWFIIPVKDYHAGGREKNRRRFCELVQSCTEPVGLLAYLNDCPVGWCAVGPRARYIRAIRTPTFKERDASEDGVVWLVPCFFVRADARHAGVSRALLERAVSLAEEHGAIAIEGFPYAGSKRRSGGDIQVGVEPVFASCGFSVLRRPSDSRVVMRRDLKR